MKIRLKVDTIGSRVLNHNLQQLTPDIHFTCDGHITKWIVGAQFDSVVPLSYPELQVWRNIGNESYLISGTILNITTENPLPFMNMEIFRPFLSKLVTSLEYFSQLMDSTA